MESGLQIKQAFRGLGVLALALAQFGCGGAVTLKGRVVNTNGSPLFKAEVATMPETDVVVSNSRGYFALRQRITDLGDTQPIELGTYRVRIWKLGFEEVVVNVDLKAGAQRLATVTLKERKPEIKPIEPKPLKDNKNHGHTSDGPKWGT